MPFPFSRKGALGSGTRLLSSVIVPSCQRKARQAKDISHSSRTTGLISSTEKNGGTGGDGLVGSGVLLSATPTTWPRLLTSKAWPLLPPRVGSGAIVPFCQRNGRHIRLVPKRQKSSPSGSGV